MNNRSDHFRVHVMTTSDGKIVAKLINTSNSFVMNPDTPASDTLDTALDRLTVDIKTAIARAGRAASVARQD